MFVEVLLFEILHIKRHYDTLFWIGLKINAWEVSSTECFKMLWCTASDRRNKTVIYQKKYCRGKNMRKKNKWRKKKQLSDLYSLHGQAHYFYWKLALQQAHLVHISHTATDWEEQHEGSHIVRPKAHTNEQRLHFSSTVFKISARSILAQHLLLSKCGLLNNQKETKMTGKLKC